MYGVQRRGYPSMSDTLHGTYQGVVVRDDDPLRQHRVVLRVPQILGSSSTGWCDPSSATAVSPAPGDKVRVSFLGGDVHKPVWLVEGGLKRTGMLTGTSIKVSVPATGLAYMSGVGPGPVVINSVSQPVPVPASAFPWWALPKESGKILCSINGSVALTDLGPTGIPSCSGNRFHGFYEVG